MRNGHQKHRDHVIGCNSRKQFLIGRPRQRRIEVFNGPPVGSQEQNPTNHTVRTQGKDQGRHPDARHPQAVHGARADADQDAGEHHLGNAAALLGDEPRHRRRQAHGGADGNVDLPRHDDEGDADGQQRIHGCSVETVNNIIVLQEAGIRDARHQEQQQQENQAGHPSGPQQAFHLAHPARPPFFTMPKEALVSAS